MRKGIHIMLTLVLLAAVAATPFVGLAQVDESLFDETATSPETSAIFTLPTIAVSSATINDSSYKAGDTVTGTLIIKNTGLVNLQTYHYVGITKGDDRVVSPVVGGPLFVEASKEKRIPFSYTIPTSFAGKMTLQVGVISSDGYVTGFRDIPITVAGSDTSLTIGKADFVGTDTKQYSIEVTNNSKVSLSVTPKLDLYTSLLKSSATHLKSSDLPGVTIGAGKSTKVMVDLPTDLPAGRISGTVEFKDATGQVKSERVAFNYVVSGSSASIHMITANKTALLKNDTVSFTVVEQGAPEGTALLTSDKDAGEKVTLKLQAFNQSGQSIGVVEDTHTLPSSGLSKTYTIASRESAQAVNVKAQIVQNDKILATYEAPISMPTHVIAVPETTPVPFYSNPIVLGVMAIVLLLILLVVLRLGKKNKVPVAVLLVGFLLTGSLAVVGIEKVYGSIIILNTTYESYHTFVKENVRGGMSSPAYTVNMFGNNGVVAPGEQFYLTGIIYIQHGSYPQKSGINAKLHKQGDGGAKDEVHGQGWDIAAGPGGIRAYSYTLGPYTAPTTPGNYEFTINGVRVCTSCKGRPAGARTANFLIGVANPGYCPPPPANAPIPASGICIPGNPVDTDVCPNEVGNQSVPPPNEHVDPVTGDCVSDVVVGTDQCPNIPGNQLNVPPNKHIDLTTGDCVDDTVVIGVCAVPDGSACASAPNACGLTNGTYNCATNTCVPPAVPVGGCPVIPPTGPLTCAQFNMASSSVKTFYNIQRATETESCRAHSVQRQCLGDGTITDPQPGAGYIYTICVPFIKEI